MSERRPSDSSMSTCNMMLKCMHVEFAGSLFFMWRFKSDGEKDTRPFKAELWALAL